MALIDCPECGAKISDKAPTCPHCGVPVAATLVQPAGAPTNTTNDASAPAQTNESAQTTAAEAKPLATERSAEPFSLRGRRIPIAAILFWGGMTLGLILKAVAGEGEETPFRYVPITMIFAGVLWFAVTEFLMLMRNRVRR
jgi:hypothetical protein